MSNYLKEELIKTLYAKGIDDAYVLKAMNKIDREIFVPDAYKIHAYEDIALPIGEEQTISQPYTVAFMTQSLQITKGMKVLEIGTGSGYQGAILYQLGARVFTIERLYVLFNSARKIFDDLGFNILAKYGDGSIGWSEHAPYDRIIVTAGAPHVPESLKKQLAIGGKLVIPVGSRREQVLEIITKVGTDEFEIENVPDFEFVPLIGKDGWNEK